MLVLFESTEGYRGGDEVLARIETEAVPPDAASREEWVQSWGDRVHVRLRQISIGQATLAFSTYM